MGGSRLGERMKILMPVISRKNTSPKLGDGNALGGIERFQDLVFQNIDGIIPVYLTYDIISGRKIDRFIASEAEKHQADVIFWNSPKKYAVRSTALGLPVVMLNHEPATRSRPMLENYPNLLEFTDRGGKLWFVSADQHRKANEHAMRLAGRSIDGVLGYVSSAFANGDEQVADTVEYDAITVGRSEDGKNPFWLHSALNKSHLTSCVLTRDSITGTDNEMAYVNKNAHWADPRFTFRNLNHADTMRTMAKGGVYVSTCSYESWGITALEALCHGLPLVLRTDKSGTHASQGVAAADGDYRLISNTKELEDAVMELRDLPYADRVAISERTKAKHLKANWIAAVSGMFTGLS